MWTPLRRDEPTHSVWRGSRRSAACRLYPEFDLQQPAERLDSRAAGLRTLKVARPALDAEAEQPVDSNKTGQRFVVSLEPVRAERVVPNALGEHRQRQAKQSAAVDAQRGRIARMP